MTLTEVFALIRDGGLLGLLVVIVFAVVKGWWVPRWQYDEKCRECAEWKELALRITKTTERIVTHVVPS